MLHLIWNWRRMFLLLGHDDPPEMRICSLVELFHFQQLPANEKAKSMRQKLPN
jgi:hypothetical protein